MLPLLFCCDSSLLTVAVPCRDASDSAGSSPVPEEEEERSPEGNNAEGTVTWQQVHGKRGQKNKKKKSKGVFVSEHFESA